MVTINETATEFQVSTDRLDVYVRKTHGNITRLRLSESAVELADLVDGNYNVWYPEYEIDGIVGTPQIRGSVTVTKIADNKIKCVWTTLERKSTWIFIFEDGIDYFTVEYEIEVLKTTHYFNAQLCHMFASCFNRGGTTDYLGNIFENWWGYPKRGNKKGNPPNNMTAFGLNKEWFRFFWLVNDSDSIAVGAVLSSAHENNARSVGVCHNTKLTKNGTWEFQWNWFGRADLVGLRLEKGLKYGARVHVIAVSGNENNVLNVVKSIFSRYGAFSLPDRESEYYAVSSSKHTSGRSHLAAHSGYIFAGWMESKKGGAIDTDHKMIVPYPESEMMINFIEYEVKKNGTSLLPTTSSGTTFGDWTDEYRAASKEHFGHKTTFKLYRNSKNVLHILGETDDISGLKWAFTMGAVDSSKYELNLVSQNRCEVVYHDPIFGDLGFTIETTNANIRAGSPLTVVPTSGQYEIKFSVPKPAEVLPGLSRQAESKDMRGHSLWFSDKK